jgi:NAD(P)-dependent dehydrogenase (short-subunit alcohol dehydrogenase family)
METSSSDTRIARTLTGVFDVRGAHVLVTGAASGIGFAFAEVMADCGARVTLTDSDGTRLDDVTRELAGRGLEVRAAALDVTDEAAVRRVVDDADATWGGLDVVFANAGIAIIPGFAIEGGQQLDTADTAAWEKVLAVNLSGVFFTMKAAAAVMKPRRSGRIVVTSSIAGLRGEPYVEYAYLASKAAVINMVRQAALELAPYDIRVNAIAPGPFVTRIATGELPGEELRASWGRIVALGRMGETEELKGAALLLASAAASFITGVVLPVDGGALVLTPGV